MGKVACASGLQKMKAVARTVTVGLIPVMLLACIFLVTEQMPGAKFSSLLLFCTAVGVSGINHAYSHRNYFLGCLYAISEVILLRDLAAIKASPYYTFLCDSSTDVATIKGLHCC